MEVLAQNKMLPRQAVIGHVPRKAGFRSRAVLQQDVKTADSKTGMQDIYVGKGRFIKDDPKKYPRKEDAGLFLGATGGWAGGEAGLWQLREELQATKAKKPAPAAAVASKGTAPKVSEKGKAAIYVGKAKFIVDDPRKYPGREDVGFLPSATGGFAGGEKGLKMFVETGDVELRDANQPGGTQYSPITFSFLLVLAGAGGGLLLNGLLHTGKEVVVDEVVTAPIDDGTKSLLLLALVLLGSVAAVGGARAGLNSIRDRLKDGAEKLVVNAAFWVATLFATAVVLQN